MTKSVKEVMQEAMFNSLVSSVGALKQANVDNVVLREIKAMHSNTTFNDLPESVRRALKESVDQAFVKLAAEGYSIASNGR